MFWLRHRFTFNLWGFFSLRDGDGGNETVEVIEDGGGWKRREGCLLLQMVDVDFA